MADRKAVMSVNAGDEAYDENAKMLLAQKPFLANILVYGVTEFQKMNPKDVEQLIEDGISVGKTPVDTGFTNEKKEDGTTVLVGMNNENKIRNEGVVYFDIIFYVKTKDGRSKVIVNIEIQRKSPNKYDIEMRGIYYACREIASQQEREFRNQNYNDIRKVYSIWIVMNSPADSMNHIRLKSDDILGTSRWKPMYEILNVIIVRIRKKTAGKENKLHRLLSVLFETEMSTDDKSHILEEEYGIEMEGNRREMLLSMCNLSQGIREEAMEKGMKQGDMLRRLELICKKLLKNKPLQVIAEELEEDVQTIEPLYDACKLYMPDYDVNKIYESLKK